MNKRVENVVITATAIGSGRLVCSVINNFVPQETARGKLLMLLPKVGLTVFVTDRAAVPLLRMMRTAEKSLATEPRPKFRK